MSDSGVPNSKINGEVTISGAAQKGPFIKGTRILINRLDESGANTYETNVSYIKDDLGNFAFPVQSTGPILIEADGVNFNEVTGRLSQGRLQLRAVYNVTRDVKQYSYVNILTHLAYQRILKLIRQGVEVEKAIKDGQDAVVASLQTIFRTTGSDRFANLSLFSGSADQRYGNALLLSLSATLSQYVLDKQSANGGSNFDGQLAYTINLLADEIAESGQIESQDVIAGMKIAAKEVAPDKIKSFLESRGFSTGQDSVSVADMNLVIDTDGDGIVNSADGDDDNDGIPDAADTNPYTYSETPQLASPSISGSLPTQSDVSLKWSASQYATKIETQVSAAADFPLGDKITILLGKEVSTHFELAGTYYLRARSANEAGVLGPWGQTRVISAGTYENVFAANGGHRYVAVRAARDGGSLVFGQGDFDSVTKLDGLGRIAWTYTFDLEGYHLNRETTLELADGTLVFRGDDTADCCRPILLALTPDGHFYWRKFADRQDDNSWTATNVVEIDRKLYTIYLGRHCGDTSLWATCTALDAAPRLLSIDPKTGETLSSVELPALDRFITGVPFFRNSLPALKRYASPDVPAALMEPLWSRVYSLLATQQKKLVVTFSARWFRHDCYAGDCTGFGRIGISKDGVADWCNADGWMTNESDGVRVVSFPGFGMLSLGAATNGYSWAVLGSGQDLRADELPIGRGNAHFDLATNAWDRNLYMASYTGGIAVTIVNKTSQTIERIRFPCIDQFQCAPISIAESTDGGIVLLYERRTGADQRASMLVAKGAFIRQ